jgi:hypothetical protein
VLNLKGIVTEFYFRGICGGYFREHFSANFFFLIDFCENAKINNFVQPYLATAGIDCTSRAVGVYLATSIGGFFTLFFISKDESTTGGLLFLLV